MHKYLSKIFIIICLFSLLSLNMLFVYAEPDENLTSEDVLTENTVTDESPSTESENDETSSEETPEDPPLEESDEDIYTEDTSDQSMGQVQQSSVDNMDITSVKNINGLPEANLELNNILNIILISIGVLLILLAIALLIRIGKK